MENEIGIKIKKLRQSLGLTLEEIANFVGVGKSTVAKWESGKIANMKRDKIASLSKILKVSPTYLMGWEKEIEEGLAAAKYTLDLANKNGVIDVTDALLYGKVVPISLSNSVKIKVYGSAPAGIPLEAIEDIAEEIDIPAEWVKDGSQYIGLQVKGDSMYPKYIEGDIVIVKLQPDCESGQDCVLYVNGYDATLKRVRKTNYGIMLQPLNPNYEPKEYDYSDSSVKILGVVVELRRKV